jgi:hypothetical protein
LRYSFPPRWFRRSVAAFVQRPITVHHRVLPALCSISHVPLLRISPHSIPLSHPVHDHGPPGSPHHDGTLRFHDCSRARGQARRATALIKLPLADSNRLPLADSNKRFVRICDVCAWPGRRDAPVGCSSGRRDADADGRFSRRDVRPGHIRVVPSAAQRDALRGARALHPVHRVRHAGTQIRRWIPR